MSARLAIPITLVVAIVAAIVGALTGLAFLIAIAVLGFVAALITTIWASRKAKPPDRAEARK